MKFYFAHHTSKQAIVLIGHEKYQVKYMNEWKWSYIWIGWIQKESNHKMVWWHKQAHLKEISLQEDLEE